MALKSGIVLRHADEIIEKLQRISRMLPNRLGSTMEAMGHVIIDESVKLTPVDSGDLRAGSYVNTAKKSGMGRYTSVEIGYGAEGMAEDYALIQHENLEYNHTVGQAKFLLTAINRHLRGGSARMREAIRSHLEDIILKP